MSKKKFRSIAFGSALALLLVAAVAHAEVVRKGDLQVKFEGQLSPRSLPRTSQAPVDVSVSAKITPVGKAELPQLRTMSIAINKFGTINTKGLPVCELDDIQPATTADALAVCRQSLVGEGSFTADVPASGRAPFPSDGKLYAFNGVDEGRPAILAHVYGVRPAPTSFTLVFLLSKSGGTYGNTLKVALPSSKAGGAITGISLKLGKTFKSHGKTQSYVTGSCPAPKGVNVAGFPFAKASLSFSDGRKVDSVLSRSCSVRGK